MLQARPLCRATSAASTVPPVGSKKDVSSGVFKKKKKITASSDVSLTGLVATATHDAFAPGETCSPLFLLVCGAVDEVAEVFFGVNTAEQLFRGCFRDPHLLWGRKSTLRKIFLPFQQKYKIKLGGIVAFSLPVERLKTPSHAIFFGIFKTLYTADRY